MRRDNSAIEKLIFWDYGPGSFDKLPPNTVAQRLVDQWPAIDEAYHDKTLSRSDMLEILKRIDQVIARVKFCESVRE